MSPKPPLFLLKIGKNFYYFQNNVAFHLGILMTVTQGFLKWFTEQNIQSFYLFSHSHFSLPSQNELKPFVSSIYDLSLLYNWKVNSNQGFGLHLSLQFYSDFPAFPNYTLPHCLHLIPLRTAQNITQQMYHRNTLGSEIRQRSLLVVFSP